MALIGKIREKSYLLIIMLGVALGAFILTDSLRTCQRTSGEIQSQGTIFGEPIDEKKYNDILEEEMMNERNRLAQEGKEMTEKNRETARDRAWNEYVRQTIMNKQYVDLGIEVSPEELNDFVHGENIHPQIKQIPYFQNQQKQFVRDSLVNFINNVLPQNNPQAVSFWKGIEEFIKGDRKVKKYLTLVQKGIYVTTPEAQMAYQHENGSRTARYIVKKYNEIPMTEIDSLTEEDLRAFYEEHKDEKKYETKEIREVKYVEFPIAPSAEDKEQFASRLERIKERFEKVANDTSAVYSFVNANAASEQFDPSIQYKAGTPNPQNPNQKGVYPKSIDSLIVSAAPGDVIGPVEWFNGNMALVKVFNNDVKEEQATVRHILLSTQGKSDEEKKEVKARADSLVRVINSQDNFEEMVVEFSEDPGSKNSGGVYEWFTKGKMVPPFEKASFEGELNKLQVVETSYGYHIVEPLDRRTVPTPSLAIIDKEISPSRTTVDSIRKEAMNAMYAEKEYLETIDAIAEQTGKPVKNARLVIDNYSLPQFEKVSSLKKWAFDGITSEGDISEPISTGNKIVIAQLDLSIAKGVPSFEAAKTAMKSDAIKHKKAQKYMAMLEGVSSIDEAANKVGTKVLTNDLKFNTNTVAGGGGNEPEVVGTVFYLEQGKISAPIEGNTGVYVVEVTAINQAPETSDLTAQKESLTQEKRRVVDASVYGALLKKADVQDNRRKLEYNME